MNGEPADGFEVESGTIRDVSYAGMVTRFHVDLDDGRVDPARAAERGDDFARGRGGLRGRQVKVGWRREHTVAVAGGGTSVEQATHQQEEMD